MSFILPSLTSARQAFGIFFLNQWWAMINTRVAYAYSLRLLCAWVFDVPRIGFQATEKKHLHKFCRRNPFCFTISFVNF